MGQKVNPISFRLGSFLPWRSRWFSDTKEYKKYLLEDIKIRRFLFERLKLAGVAEVEIERLPKSITLIIKVSRPGVVIGRGGTGLEELKKEILALLRKEGETDLKNLKVDLKIEEVKEPDLSAYLVATRIAGDLERRLPHRRVVTKAMERVMQAGALGIKVVLSGRIEGADIARQEKYQLGSVPSQTLREEIDYAQVPALPKKGYVGVKVYIHKKKE